MKTRAVAKELIVVGLAVAVHAVLVTARAWSATLHVPSEHPTIQEALDAAQDGDTVLVADGEYLTTFALDGNRLHDPADPEGAPVRNFRLESENGPESTILRSTAPSGTPQSVLVFRHGEGPSTIVAGFTITGGSGMPVFFGGKTGGGGILCVGSSPSIRNCRLVDNECLTAGGGILSLDGAWPTVLDCIVEENRGGLGGGVAAVGDDSLEQATGISMDRCVIRRNASLMGGGVFADFGAGVELEDCVIAENEALVLGGGVSLLDAKADLERCRILRNHAESGGGIYAGNGSHRLVNCLIAGNAASNGGGVFLEVGPGTGIPGGASFAHCTIADNSALETPSGGMYFFEPLGDLQSCILWGNRGGSIHAEGGTGRIRSSIVEGQDVDGGDGNSNGDPVFLAAGAWDAGPIDDDPFDDEWILGDYRLADGSPAIDSAIPEGAPPDDLEDRPRPCGKGFDRGAHEAGGCQPSSPRFRRGDSNADGTVNLTDAVFTLDGLFRGGPQASCADAADANDDASMDLTDAIYTLDHLFRGGPALPSPGTDCGSDETRDALDCASDGC